MGSTHVVKIALPIPFNQQLLNVQFRFSYKLLQLMLILLMMSDVNAKNFRSYHSKYNHPE